MTVFSAREGLHVLCGPPKGIVRKTLGFRLTLMRDDRDETFCLDSLTSIIYSSSLYPNDTSICQQFLANIAKICRGVGMSA